MTSPAPSTLAEQIDSDLTLRVPSGDDGADTWRLIKNTGVLDVNSSYQYLMWCKYFASTSVVAESEGSIVGFISGYILPDKPNTLFIWQVAVDSSQRGKGVGSAMLRHLLRRPACEDVRYVEATVSPSNAPSQSLFKKLARDLETDCDVTLCFSKEQFPESGHEDEETYRIGPFSIEK